jgi:hypothetical protein
MIPFRFLRGACICALTESLLFMLRKDRNSIYELFRYPPLDLVGCPALVSGKTTMNSSLIDSRFALAGWALTPKFIGGCLVLDGVWLKAATQVFVHYCWIASFRRMSSVSKRGPNPTLSDTGLYLSLIIHIVNIKLMFIGAP